MSGPNPIVVDFLVKDLDKVLKAMKSIQDAATGTEKASTVAAKAGASERQKAREAEAKIAARSYLELVKALEASEKAGTTAVSKELRKRIAVRERTATMAGKLAKQEADNAVKERQRAIKQLESRDKAHVDYQRKLKDQWVAQSSSKEAQHVAYQRKLKDQWLAQSTNKEAAHLHYQRQLRQQHFDRLHKVEQAALRGKDAQRKVDQSRAESDAQKRIDHAADVAKKLAVAEQRAHFEARRGGNFDPRFSPQAQLRLLRDSKNKSPEEQKAALDKVAKMRDEAKLANEIGRKKAADAKREQDKAAREEKALQDKSLREEKSRQRQATQEFERNQRKRTNELRRQHEARERAEERLEKSAERRREFFNRTAGNVITGVGGIVNRAARGAFNTVTGLGGGFDVQTALQDKVNVEKQAGLLSVASRTPGMKAASKAQILRDSRAVSVATGIDQSEVIEGLNQFTAKTGNYDAGARNAKFFGKVSKATGTSLKDVMATAGIMTVQNKKLGKGALGEEALQKLILSTVMQARQGSVEFEDLARAGGMITRTASAYAGNQDENQRKLMGLSQIGVRTGGKAEVAATDLSNLVSDSTTHKGEVEELLGRKFKDERGRIIGGPDKFIGDLMEAAMARKGGLDNLSNEGGDGKRVFGQRSMRFFQALAPVYNEAQQQALAEGKSEDEAKKAGAAAVREDIATSIQTDYSKEQMEAEFSEVMKSSAEKFEGAVRELKVGIADQLLPQLVQLIPVLKALTPVLVNLVSFLGKLTGTDIGSRANSGAENMIAGANALGDLRTGKITPEQAKQIQDELGADTAKRETGSKDKVGKVFDAVTASFIDIATLGFAGQTKKLRDEKSVSDPSEKKAIEEQKALYDQLGKAIAQATAELNKVKAPSGGGGEGGAAPAAPAAPVTPIIRR